MIVRDYTIQLQTYHDEIVGRLQFINANNEREETALYSLGELSNIVACWTVEGGLGGSFAIGTTLARDASFNMVSA